MIKTNNPAVSGGTGQRDPVPWESPEPSLLTCFPRASRERAVGSAGGTGIEMLLIGTPPQGHLLRAPSINYPPCSALACTSAKEPGLTFMLHSCRAEQKHLAGLSAPRAALSLQQDAPPFPKTFQLCCIRLPSTVRKPQGTLETYDGPNLERCPVPAIPLAQDSALRRCRETHRQ